MDFTPQKIMGKVYRPVSIYRTNADKLLAESKELRAPDPRRTVMLLEALVNIGISIDNSLMHLTTMEE